MKTRYKIILGIIISIFGFFAVIAVMPEEWFGIESEQNYKWIILAHWSSSDLTKDTSYGFNWFNKELVHFNIPNNTKEWVVEFKWWNGEEDCTAGLTIYKEGETKSIGNIFKQDIKFGEKEFNFGSKYLEGTYYIKMNTSKMEFEIKVSANIPEFQEEPEIVTGEVLKWNTYGVYEIKPEVFMSGNFHISNEAKKIKLTFEVNYTMPTPQYVLQIKFLRDGEIFWEKEGTYEKQTQIFEIEEITGDFTMSIYLVLGRAMLTVEWYG